MSSLSDPASRRILDAALHLFARHGFRRTSMGDLAREAGIARATLYLRFADKRAIIGALAACLVDDALAAAGAAWRAEAPLADNLAAMLLARDLPLYRLLKTTPHGAELLAIDASLTSAHAARLQSGFCALLRERAEALNTDLAMFGGASGFAQLLSAAAGGLKHEFATEMGYVEAVRMLALVVARAVER